MNSKTDWGKLQTLQKTYKRGTELTTQGKNPKGLFVLMSGRLSVIREGIEVAQIRKRGEYIGEIAVLLKIPASATVTATTDVIAIEIESSKAVTFFNHTPEIAIALARKMADRLVELNSNFSQLVDKSYRPDLIKSLEKKQNHSIENPVSDLNLEKLKSFFVEYAEGSDILTQGQYPSALYILVKGSLEIIKNGKVIAIEDKPGYYLGDVSILRETFSNATVTTREKSTLIEININKVENFLSHSPEIALSIAVKLAERTIAINELFLDLQVDAIRDIKKKEQDLKKEQVRQELLQRKKQKEEQDLEEKLQKENQKAIDEKKKEEIRREISERKRLKEEQQKLINDQLAISNQINELKKVEQDVYKLLGMDLED